MKSKKIKGKHVLIAGSGPSLKRHWDKIKLFINKYDIITVGGNNINSIFNPDYHFWGCDRRWKKYGNLVSKDSTLIFPGGEKEKVINQSWEAYNKVIPKARGEGEKTIRESEGYALERINEAKGDATRFIATWEAYKNAKDVTKKRLYLETMQKVLPKAGRIFVASPENTGILPLLNLTEGVKGNE